MKIRFLLVVLSALQIFTVAAQDFKAIENLRQKRTGRIDIQHVGVGMDVGALDNLSVGPKIYYGLGSYRNLLNADAGVKYEFSNPFNLKKEEMVAGQYFTVFASAHLNFVRREMVGIYFGAEIAYGLAISASYRIPFSEVVLRDSKISKNHPSVCGKTGIRFGHWDMNVFFEYDMAPSINQKYVFESDKFDYDKVSNRLYERYHIGLSFSYLIPINR